MLGESYSGRVPAHHHRRGDVPPKTQKKHVGHRLDLRVRHYLRIDVVSNLLSQTITAPLPQILSLTFSDFAHVKHEDDYQGLFLQPTVNAPWLVLGGEALICFLSFVLLCDSKLSCVTFPGLCDSLGFVIHWLQGEYFPLYLT